MPEENVQNEKISLDFSEDLGNNDFGIQNTQVIAAKELNSFLLSDPDELKEIKKEEEEAAQAAAEAEKLAKQQQQRQTPDEGKNKPTPAEKPDGSKALNDVIFGEEETNEEDLPVGSKKPVTQKTNDAGAEGEDDTFTTLGRDLMRLGVFQKNTDDESEENLTFKSGEDFLERFNLEKKKGAINILDNFLSQFGDDYKKMFDAVFVNGVKPQEYLQSFAKIEAMSNIDLSSEDNQERVIRAYYKGLKWDDAKIENRITKLRDYGDLEDEAKTYHEVLLNKEKEDVANKEKVEQQKKQQEKDKDLSNKKSYQRILSEKFKNQEFDGISIPNQKEVDDTVQYLSEKKYKLESGELLSEFDKDLLELNRPENHELKVKLGLLLRKKLDLTSVKKTTISKKSDALFTLSTKNAKQQQNSKEKEMKSFF